MTAAKYIEYDPANARYTMAPEHAMILANEDSPFFMGGFMQMIVPEVSMAPKLMESFRTGKGLPQSEYPPEVFEAIERGSAPIYRHQLVRKWIPTMVEVEARSEARRGGARCRLWQRTRSNRDGVGVSELALSWLRRASGVGRSRARQRRGGRSRGSSGVRRRRLHQAAGGEIRLHFVLRRDSRLSRSGRSAEIDSRGAQARRRVS